MLHVGAHENQLAGAALAFGGGDTGLGASDLVLQGALFLALKGEELFFSSGQGILKGRPPVDPNEREKALYAFPSEMPCAEDAGQEEEWTWRFII